MSGFFVQKHILSLFSVFLFFGGGGKRVNGFCFFQRTGMLKPRFQMLKQFMMNPDVSAIEVEEKFITYAAEERKDKYKTVT